MCLLLVIAANLFFMDHIINAVTTEDLAGFAIFLFIRRRFFSTGDLKRSGKHY